MGDIVRIVPGARDESRDLDLAKACMESLQKAYPNYYWVVEFTGHNLVVKLPMVSNLLVLACAKRGRPMTGHEAFGARLPRESIGTVHDAQAAAVKQAGLILEIFKLPRGPWNGVDMPVIPDGMIDMLVAGKQLRGWG